MKDLKETTAFMISDDYKERFKAEYWQTKIRYEKLKAFNTKIEAFIRGEKVDEPKHDCSYELLRKQQYAMEEYLHILELRAVVEGVDLVHHKVPFACTGVCAQEL